MNAIEIQKLKKTYENGTEALKGADITIEKGDFFGLLGANGAGKTTIIGILTGLVNKTSGTVNIFDLDIEKQHNEAKAKIGVVPQEMNFNIFEKVIDIIVDQAGFYGIPPKEALKRAERILKALELWEKRDQKSMTLSGGMKRRLMIARALMHEPELLILDEPTAGVDVELRHGMWEYLKELNANGTTILLTTHYLEEAEQLCKNLAMIRKGEIVKTGPVKELLRSVDSQTYSLEVDAFDALPKTTFALTKIDQDTIEADVSGDQTITDLINEMKQGGITINSIQPKGNRLEKLFLELNK